MDRGAVGDRLAQGLERARRVAGCEPVAGHLAGITVRAGQLLGDLAMQRPPAQPRDALVDRVADERMTEPRFAVLGLDDEAGGEQLGDRPLARDPSEDLEVHARAGDGRRLRGRLAVVGEPRGLDEHGVADRRGQRHVAVEREIEPLRARRQTAGVLQRRGQLLDEERGAPRAVVQEPGETGARR